MKWPRGRVLFEVMPYAMPATGSDDDGVRIGSGEVAVRLPPHDWLAARVVVLWKLSTEASRSDPAVA